MSLRSELQGVGSHFHLKTNVSVPVTLQHEGEADKASCYTCLTLAIPPQVIVDMHELHMLNKEQRLLQTIQGPLQVEFLVSDINRNLEAPWTAQEVDQQTIALRWPGTSSSQLSIPLHTRTLPAKKGTSSTKELLEPILVERPQGFVSCRALGAPREFHVIPNTIEGAAAHAEHPS